MRDGVFFAAACFSPVSLEGQDGVVALAQLLVNTTKRSSGPDTVLIGNCWNSGFGDARRPPVRRCVAGPVIPAPGGAAGDLTVRLAS